MPDTTTTTTNNAPPLAAATSLAEGVEVLQGLDANGYDYTVIGVAAHIVLETARGRQVSMETLGDEEDETALDAVNELLDAGYLVEVDGCVFPARYDAEDPA